MKLVKVKTARFSQVIEKCGKPQVYTLWQKPSADRHLQIANKEQSGHDSSKERERDGLWNRRLQRKKRRNLSRFSQVAETLRRQADRWDRLGACFVNSRYPGGQASARLPSKWTCRCGTLSPASGPQLITTR